MNRRTTRLGGSIVARLSLIALVPMLLALHLGWRDINQQRDLVSASTSLRGVLAFERRVAAVSGPWFTEYLSHLGLAAFDRDGTPRVLARTVSGLDYLQVYRTAANDFDQAVAALARTDGDLVLSDGRRLGDVLAEFGVRLADVRAATDQQMGDSDEVTALFADLEAVIDDALATKRSIYDQVTVPVSLKRYRAESTGLSWVLRTAGDVSKAVLVIATQPGRHREAVGGFTAAHRQSSDQFRELLAPDRRPGFQRLADSAPDVLRVVPDVIEPDDLLGDAWASTSADVVEDEIDYLHRLGAWADDYYADVLRIIEANESAGRDALARTITTIAVITMVALVLVWLTARSILRPLLRLGRRAAEIGRGEIALGPLPVRGPTMLRAVTRTMNAMHATLRQVERQAAAIAEGRLDDPSLREDSPGTLGASLRSSVERLARVTAQLQASEERSSAIVSYATVAIWTVDDERRIVSANSAATELLAVPAEAQVGASLEHWFTVRPGECEVHRADGSRLWIDVDLTEVETSAGRLSTVIAEDVTERKEFERRLAHQARTDALTGLPNRFAVLERLGQLSDGLKPAWVLFIDVDGFKSVNDTKGHAVGDLVLVEIARRLNAEVRTGGMVARLGGDEFVVVVTDLPDEAAVVRLGRRLIERVEQPYDIDDALFAISASVGVATMLPAESPLDVLHRADSAVYHAKDLGRARVEVYDQAFQERVEQRAELELAMREGIARGDVEMHLQPVFDLVTGRPVGAEALARWHRPGIGQVSPAEFVAIAENSSLIVELTRSMLVQACERVVQWKRRDPACALRLAVNLSGRHIIDGDLVGDLRDVIAATGADPHLLELELTETQLLADLDRAAEVLQTVRAMGVTVAVDDFGTGFSSMAYLRQFQVDVIKVDRSFVVGAGSDGFDSTAIAAMVNFGRVLGVHVVAEGVETAEQLAFVRARGCTRAQGFYLGMPAPPDDTEHVLFGTHVAGAPTVAGHAGHVV